MPIRLHAYFYFLIIAFAAISCGREEGSSQTTDEAVSDSAEFTFNPENEFLGLGIPQFGDLDSMVARRRIRALVPYTRLYYYIDGKERKGLAFETLNLFEKALNKSLRLKVRQVHIIFIPVNRSQVIPLLRDGYADLAYSGMTITEERKKLVDFSIPSITGLREIIIGGKSAPRLNSLADLAGREIYVRSGSSYESCLVKLSDSLKKKNLPAIVIRAVDPFLETEDILQMVNSGTIPYSATAEDIARIWSEELDSLILYDDFPLDSNVSYGWVFRKDCPKLRAEADKFIAKNAKGTYMGNVLYNKYVKNTKLVLGMHSAKTMEQVKSLQAIFQKYADRYRLDWLLLAAQGYQESGLNQLRKSNAGAIGIMQVLPSTAAGSPIFIRNIDNVENNIHAGVKYMRYIIDDFFDDPEIDTLNRHLLALASYNAGPARIARLRKIARDKGLDPNPWFDNVEIIAAQYIGRETVQYVGNIYKFYASYRALNYYASQRGINLLR